MSFRKRKLIYSSGFAHSWWIYWCYYVLHWYPTCVVPYWPIKVLVRTFGCINATKKSSFSNETSALRELLFTLYLHSGLRPSVWGNLPLTIEIFKTLRYNKKYLSRDIGINKIGICTSNFPSGTVETTVLEQF